VALRKLANHANKCGCTIMFINQLRYKVMHSCWGCHHHGG
jgi:RecA/RadA recombinase